MKNEVVKQDVVFTPQEKMADNLNNEEFTEKMLSEDYFAILINTKSNDEVIFCKNPKGNNFN